MKRIPVIFLLLQAVTCLIASDKYPRNNAADIIHYEFNLFLNDSVDVIEGMAVVEVAFYSTADSICLDLKNMDANGKGMEIVTVHESGNPARWKHAGDRLSIYFSKAHVVRDTAEFRITYRGVPADGLIISNNRFMDRVFFSDHWPNRAHNYLPCIDHPYDKASVDFIITAPSAYRVVANGDLASDSAVSDRMRRTHWSEKVELPVKVMAFGAAFFEVDTAGVYEGIPVTSWVFFQNRREGFNDYSVAPGPLRYYSELIGNYPYSKLANVQSKTIFGGLENAGTVFYSERSVTGKGLAERLVAHELAHQWFGNHVTEEDWHHAWLSEGFATYLTSMYFQQAKGEDAFRTDMDSTRARIVRFYMRSKSPLVDTTVTDLMKLLNTNTYQKGAWVLHMLRNEVGEEFFVKGLREFYRLYGGTNVLTDDFRAMMEKVSGKDLSLFFRQWVYTAGHPVLNIATRRGQKRNTWEVKIEQEQESLFEFGIEIKISSDSRQNTINVHMNDRVSIISVKSKKKPEIIPDPEVRLLYERYIL